MPKSASSLPVEIGKIFVLSGPPADTFIEPEQLKDLVGELRNPGRGLIIEGPSGIGKSTMVWKALNDLGIKKPAQQWFRCTDPNSLEQLDKLIKKGFKGPLVIDDFHYMDDDRVKRVANRLHALADSFPAATASTTSPKMICIGVERVGNRLLQARSDLGHRLGIIYVKSQSRDKMEALLNRGQKAANILFREKDEIIKRAGGSFSILQLICLRMALRSGIEQRQPREVVITDSPLDVLPEIIIQMEDAFDDALRKLIKHDDVSPPRGAGLVLLWLLAQSSTDSISLDEARARYPELGEAFDWLQGPRLTQFVDDSEVLRRWLHYDGNKKLLIQDPRLGFYLRQLTWARFIGRLGPIGMRLDGDRLEVALGATPVPATARRTPPPSAAASAAAASPPRPPSAAKNKLPASLIERVQKRMLIPFVGAGVSRAVLHQRTRKPLFPSWSELLQRAATRVRGENKADVATLIRNLIRNGKSEDFLDAARRAREALLGSLWSDFLAAEIDRDESDAAPDSLALAQTLWTLGSKLIVTTNYDQVLQWAYYKQTGRRAQVANISAPVQLPAIISNSVQVPTVWHLHGSVQDLANIVLTPDGYQRLYPINGSSKPVHEGALMTLNTLMAGYAFLFIGVSFTDQIFAAQMQWINELFKEHNGPHYLLVRAAELASTQARLAGLKLVCIPYADYGRPQVELLEELAKKGARRKRRPR